MFLVLGEENVGGSPVLRVLARTDNEDDAKRVFDAIALGEAFDRVLLVKVLREG